MKRPNGFVHATCLTSLERQFADEALVLIKGVREAIDNNEQPNVDRWPPKDDEIDVCKQRVRETYDMLQNHVAKHEALEACVWNECSLYENTGAFYLEYPMIFEGKSESLQKLL